MQTRLTDQKGRDIPMNVVRLSCDLLEGTGKKGVLPANADGYYTLVLGAYGTRNSAGMIYDRSAGAAMFDPNSILMRRVKKRVLYLEYKHPEPFEMVYIDGQGYKKPMTEDQYLNRIRKIDDDRVCGHIRDVYLIESKDAEGRDILLVIGEVCPYGPYGKHFEASLKNPSINTYCSVRSITQDDMMRGIKYTREIVTWDFVGEGGIIMADKYSSPALEDFEPSSVILTPPVLWKMQDQYNKATRLGLENSETGNVDALIDSLGWARKAAVRAPSYMRKW